MERAQARRKGHPSVARSWGDGGSSIPNRTFCPLLDLAQEIKRPRRLGGDSGERLVPCQEMDVGLTEKTGCVLVRIYE